jgi:putative transcriptional regulator
MKKTTVSAKTANGVRSMSREAIERAALADPDAQPLSPADLERMERTPQAKVVRRALRLREQSSSAEDLLPPLSPKTS